MSHDRLIADLFPDKDLRRTVDALVSALPRTMKQDHVTALIHELAAPVPEGQTGEQSVAFIGSFITAIGGLQHERDAFTNWVNAGGPGAFPDPAPVTDEPAVDPGAAAAPVTPPVPAGPNREALQAQIDQHERNMRAEPGSEPWRNYWTRGGSADCLDARRTLETTPAEPVA